MTNCCGFSIVARKTPKTITFTHLWGELNFYTFQQDSAPARTACKMAELSNCERPEDVVRWTASNSLQLNPSKTEFLWCTTTRRLHLIDNGSFSLGGGHITALASVRDLDAYFDRHMSMTTHVNRLVSSSFYQLRRIKAIRRSLPTATAITLVNSFVISKIDYCNSLLSGLPSYQLTRVQSVLNAAARIKLSTVASDLTTSHHCCAIVCIGCECQNVCSLSCVLWYLRH